MAGKIRNFRFVVIMCLISALFWKMSEGGVSKKFPYQAFIKIFGEDQTCGGALISKQHVLTSARCLVQYHENEISIKLGISDLSDRGTEYRVDFSSVFIHPNIDLETYENDIAVIKLPQEVSRTDDISPISLPNINDLGPQLEGMTAIVTGWERDGAYGSLSTTKLQYFKQTILSQESCNKYYKNKYGWAIEAGRFCTKVDESAYICRGFNGSPLIIPDSPDKLVGIVSLGEASCSIGGPIIYTAVAKYIEWIQNICEL